MRRHVVLIGLPGAGKSSIGRLVAEELHGQFVDLDLLIASRTGRSVEAIFAGEGEPAFRQLEREAMAKVLQCRPSVLAPGGGWAAQPGNLEAARPQSWFVHLACDPAVAAARIRRGRSRPLLAGGDAEHKLRALLEVRLPYYRQADAEVAAGTRPPGEAALEIAALARRHAGW